MIFLIWNYSYLTVTHDHYRVFVKHSTNEPHSIILASEELSSKKPVRNVSAFTLNTVANSFSRKLSKDLLLR